MNQSNKEREILMLMRKTLGNVVKDTTPAPGTRHTLTEHTIQDIRLCLGLITTRERELADEAGAVVERPYYTDEQPTEKVVSISSIQKKPQESE